MGKMRAGIVSGIVLMVVGLGLLGFEYYMISSEKKFYPKLLALGFALTFMSLALFIFPGAKMTFTEMRAQPAKGRGGPLWAHAPMGHKVAWIIAIVIGVGIGIYTMIDLENGGPINEFLQSTF